MARKKEEWVIDEWDDSLDTGKRPQKPDPFSIDVSGINKSDDWDDDLIISGKGKLRQTGNSADGRNKKPAIILTSAAILIVIAIAIFTVGKPLAIPSESIIEIISHKPIETITELSTKTATQTPTGILQAVVNETSTNIPTRKPTNAPTEKPSATPSPEPVTALENNPWYAQEYRYYYQFLTDHEKEVFTKIYEGLINCRKPICFGFATSDEIGNVLDIVWSDCPELFNIESFSYTNSELYPVYRMEPETYQQKCDHIHSTINNLKSSFSLSDDDFSRELIVYRYLIDHCDYLAAGNDTTAYADACLCSGKSQCSGYAAALNLVLRSVGIQSMEVANNDHAWNVVNINDDWYQCDVTWDDTGTDGIRTTYVTGEDEYNGWMNLPDRLSCFTQGHTYDVKPGLPVPQCTKIDESYAKRCAIYIGPGMSNPAEIISNYLQEARRKGKHHVLMMLDDASYLSKWDSIWNDLYYVYNNYGWAIYPPNESNRCIYAIDEGN